MLVVVTERVEDVRHDADAAFSALCFSLLPSDDGVACGYARVVACVPVGRWDGVAVLIGDTATAPDPVQVRVRESGKAAKAAGSTIEVRRKALPVLLRVDRVTGGVSVVRRIEPPAGG